MPRITELIVNGAPRPIDADSERTLLSVLRDDLDFAGCKYGCGEGQCGACTVLLDGVAVHSCRTPVGRVGTRKITTIEGISENGQLHPVQESFLKHDAFQCSYCTCGMIMAAVSLLRKKPNPTDAEIISGMDGNICRCGTYPRIIAAIKDGAKALQGGAR